MIGSSFSGELLEGLGWNTGAKWLAKFCALSMLVQMGSHQHCFVLFEESGRWSDVFGIPDCFT
jgi:hypothetical protein